jgi:hypothetical protein
VLQPPAGCAASVGSATRTPRRLGPPLIPGASRVHLSCSGLPERALSPAPNATARIGRHRHCWPPSVSAAAFWFPATGALQAFLIP